MAKNSKPSNWDAFLKTLKHLDRGEVVTKCPFMEDEDLAREIREIFGDFARKMEYWDYQAWNGDTKNGPPGRPESTSNVGRNAASLKLLSAMEVCRKYRDSEEIPSMGPSLIDWGRQHHSAPVAPECETWSKDYPRPRRSTNLTNCQEHDKSDKNPDLSEFEDLCDNFDVSYRCGWCRFECWIKLQGLPKQLEIYVMHVLNHLWENTRDFSSEPPHEYLDAFGAIEIIKEDGPEDFKKSGW